MSDPQIDDFLEHFGIKGMQWGVRNDKTTGVRKSTSHDAKKDAEEHARAKMFFGDGAGTRRKLIKAQIESKSKDPDYKKAFDIHSSNQDLGQHATKAKSERRRKDVRAKTGKTARGVHRSLTGGFGGVTLASGVIAAAYVGAKKAGVDQHVKKFAATAFNAVKRKHGPDARIVKMWLKNQGL